jgi:PHP family Zn ribbon phosphoesterase
MEPEETKKRGGICPVCGKPVIIGVLNRVESLADQEKVTKPKKVHPARGGARPFRHIIPLPEVVGEVLDVGPQSKRVDALYFKLLNDLGNEFQILLESPLKDIEASGGALMAEAVKRVREGKVHIDAGYDGEYGTIKLFEADERQNFGNKINPRVQLFL